MKATDMRGMSVEGLRKYILDGRQELMNLRFQQATGQIENTARMRLVKRDVARVKTILNEKAANAAAEQGA